MAQCAIFTFTSIAEDLQLQGPIEPIPSLWSPETEGLLRLRIQREASCWHLGSGSDVV